VLLGFVEAHTHLDKTMWGMPWYKNEVGPRIVDRIDNERLNSRQLGIEPARQSARQCIQSSLMGTTYVRGHADVDTDHGLRGIEGVVRTRDNYRDVVDIATRTHDARLSISRIGATFSRQPLNRLQHIQPLPSSDHSLDPSDLEGVCIRPLEGGRRRQCLTQCVVVPFLAFCHQRDKAFHHPAGQVGSELGLCHNQPSY
jgi:hypothetical protein